jgi:hypothetical protein
MKLFRTLRLGVFALLGSLLVAACSSPQLTASWKDPAYQAAPLNKVMVLGISNSDANRRIFEDSFSQALQQAGVNAQVSYPLLPESGAIPQERIQQTLAKTGADGVLVTRLINVDQRVEVSPAMGPMYGRGFYGWYGSAWAAVPPSVDTYKVLTLESTLWDMKSGKVIWSGTSDTLEVSDIAKFSQQLAKVLITKMRADKVL